MSYDNLNKQFQDEIKKMGGVSPVMPPAAACAGGCHCHPDGMVDAVVDFDPLAPIEPDTLPTIVLPAPMFHLDRPDAAMCFALAMPPGYPASLRVAGIQTRVFPDGERGLMVLITSRRPNLVQRLADWIWRTFASA